MNCITFFAILFSSFSWLWSHTSIKTSYAPQSAVGCKSYYDSALALTVYTGVEKEPEYPGGAPAWGRYINRNLNMDNIDATRDCHVSIKMIVDSSGAIRKAVPVRGDKEVIEPNAAEKEVLRIYRKSGRWVPGTCSGNNVTAEFVQSMDPCKQ
jgi:hypothetical protein